MASKTKTKVRCYLAPDWGMALRVSSLIETEFEEREVVGGWQSPPPGRCHGTLFAIESERFPESWEGRLLALREQPWVEGFSGKLELETSPEWIAAAEAALRSRRYTCPRCGVTTADPENVGAGWCPSCERRHGTDEV